MNVSAVTNATVSPPCEICGISGHIGVDCQLGSALNGIEQVIYAKYAQGMRQNQNFFKNPQNSFGQTAPPGCVKQPENFSEIKFGDSNGKLCHKSI